jgi:Tol biopolymer transport system component/imidazolonepropionase-like amidohydrolase
MRKALIAAVLSGAAVAAQSSGALQVHVTLHEGTNMAAALSPDGRTIAIDLLGTLWTLPAGGGTAKPITDIFMDARQPSWSPDSRRITFQAYRSSTWQIWTVNADGTDLKPVTSSPFDDREPAWSPDGARIAFSSDRSGNYDVWTLTLATGVLKQITNAPSNEFNPSWRGSEIAYVSDRRGAGGIYAEGDRLLAADEGALGPPAFGPNGEVVFNAIAGTHSKLLVSARNIAGDDEDVFPFRPQIVSGDVFYTADGKIKRRPSGGGAARTVDFTAEVSFTRPAFTPKGRTFDVAGSQPVRGLVNPAISPDGSQVVFAALGDLWLASVNGGVPRRITNDPALDTAPMWSPDGRSIVYSSDRAGGMNLWIHDVVGNSDRQLTQMSASAMEASWSRDGARIAFVDAEGQVQAVDVASGAVTRLHDHLNEPGRPSWSPDGSAVVVSSLRVYSTRFREGTNQVLKIASTPAAAGDRWFDPAPHKSIGMREDQGPIWSPDGKQMAAIVDGLLAVWPVAADGSPTGPPRPITTELAGSPTWTGDSRSILYQSEMQLKLVDVASKRVVRTIDPKLTWTPSHATTSTTIHAGRLWDGRTDAAQTNMDIVVRGNRITSVVKHRDELHAGTVIDASGETVIPGLVEIHSHLSQGYGEALGRIFLAWGITTVRNPATNTYESNEYREATEAGARVGPRLLSAGEPFDGTRIYYPGGTSLDEGGEVSMRLKHAKDFGFDFIKTYVRLPDLQQKRVIEEAHAMGMPVTSHELYPAVAYGADGVEHIRGTSRRGYSPKLSLLARSYQDVVDLLAQSKMTLTPTIGIQGAFRLQTLRDPTWIDDPRIQRLYPPSVWSRWRGETRTPASAAVLADSERPVAAQESTILRVIRGGGRIVAGTDAPINPYGLSLLMEMESYEHAGLTPVEVLRSATTVSAEAMGVADQIGAIEQGKLADIAFIPGDPLKSVRELRNVTRVMKDGRMYARRDLLGDGR